MDIKDLTKTGLQNNAPLFRGLSVKTGEWIYGYGWFESGEYAELCTVNGLILCVKESMGQFTGIKDKNGMQAYKGDLFYWHGALRKIVYREDKGAFMAMRLNGWQKSFFYLNDLSERFEIIGNEIEHHNLPFEVSY